MRPFVDTNVLVYANDPADPGKRATARTALLAYADELVLSAQVLSELYVVLTRRTGLAMKSDDARAIVDGFRRFPIVHVDELLVLDAIDLSTTAGIAYWDGLIVAAARVGGCDVLLSEDLTDGAEIGGVRIENPFTTA